MKAVQYAVVAGLYGVVALVGLQSSDSYAAKIAIVDSGTYFGHDLLKGRAWVNAAELADNQIDDDHNAKVDDVNGWNFSDANPQFFNFDHVKDISPSALKVMEIIGRRDLNAVTDEDKAYWEANVKNLSKEQKEKLIEQVNFYGEYAHGTHCSGIAEMMNPGATLLSAKVFPDGPSPQPYSSFGSQDHLMGQWLQGTMTSYLGDIGSGMAFKYIAEQANADFIQVANYLNEQKQEVANYSLGMNLLEVAKKYLSMIGEEEPTDARVLDVAKKMAPYFAKQGKAWMSSSPRTLFVVAAGNDSQDNDKAPTFPANVSIDNSITVAASMGFHSLASFSNFGATSVHVAAPGVAILSSVPATDSSQLLAMSGTSMAAPYVTGVAGAMKDANAALAPSVLKQLLMQTVDIKPWLKGKVISGGVVNAKRAVLAAELMKTYPLAQAVQKARTQVADVADEVIVAPARPSLMGHRMTELEKDMNSIRLVF